MRGGHGCGVCCSWPAMRGWGRARSPRRTLSGPRLCSVARGCWCDQSPCTPVGCDPSSSAPRVLPSERGGQGRWGLAGSSVRSPTGNLFQHPGHLAAEPRVHNVSRVQVSLGLFVRRIDKLGVGVTGSSPVPPISCRITEQKRLELWDGEDGDARRGAGRSPRFPYGFRRRSAVGVPVTPEPAGPAGNMPGGRVRLTGHVPGGWFQIRRHDPAGF